MAHLLSDEPALPGLLWAMRFDEDGGGRLVEAHEGLLDQGSFGEGFLWLHLNLVDTRIASLIEADRLGPRRLAASAFSYWVIRPIIFWATTLYVFNPDGNGIGIGGALPGNGFHLLEKDSWSAAVVDELAPLPDDIQVDKVGGSSLTSGGFKAAVELIKADAAA